MTNLQYNCYKNDYEKSKDVTMQSHKWLRAHEKPSTEPVGSAASVATRHANAEQSASSQKNLESKKSLPGVVTSPRHCTEGSRVKEKGRKGERATMRAGGHEATATTAGMSLATSASSPEPHMASREAHDETSDAVNLNATRTRPTRPEDKSHNPPKGLLSMLLEGRRTGVSDKLSEVPNDETTTSQSTWMPL